MEIYIVPSIAGFIAFDENLDIVDYKLFKEEEIPSHIIKIEKNEILEEEIELIENLIEKYNNLNNKEDLNKYDILNIETNNRLSTYNSIVSNNSSIENNDNLTNTIHIQRQVPNKGGEYLRSNLKKILIEIGFSNSDEFKSKLIQIYNKIATLKMKESSQEEDKLVIEAINSIDEIDESISKLVERIREWNNIYFPEIDIIQNNESYINLIANNENRDELIKNPPESIISNPNINIDIESGTNGADLEKEDIEMINEFAKSIQSLQTTRRKTEEYIDNKMEKIGPNLRDLLGSSLAAKLIAHIGGIKNLAMYSAATIQIMGAEKALFRHLKTGERPPKHGLIFQHPEVRTNPWWVRGKIARTLALKISLASKKDVFSGDFDPTISETFQERVGRIKKENPFPKKTRKRIQEERNFEKDKKGKKSKYSKKSSKSKYKNKKSKKKRKKR